MEDQIVPEIIPEVTPELPTPETISESLPVAQEIDGQA